jgi:tetratricopeptide (TPR) repeat protein
MEPLDLNDGRHLEAAHGWFELGNCLQATEELNQISPQMRGHPDVLVVRVAVFEAAKRWEYAAEVARAITEFAPESPFGWIHCALALHELKRTREARDLLLPVVDKFPDQYIIRYNLACYAAQLGDLKAARAWLEKAFELNHSKDVRRTALEDPDLEPLRSAIPQI